RQDATRYLREPAALPRELQARRCELTAAEEPAGPRLLAGTSTDPASDVRSGKLLEELHCLLGALTIPMPPLRQRVSELSVLAERMLRRAVTGHDRPVAGFTDEAWELLRAYAWPG